MKMLPQEELELAIEPQYDGVIMLSSEAILFNDAKPRPDGHKVYHVFHHTVEGETRLCDSEEDINNEDLRKRREELFSQAHEISFQNVSAVLADSGLTNQEWYQGSPIILVESGLTSQEWCQGSPVVLADGGATTHKWSPGSSIVQNENEITAQERLQSIPVVTKPVNLSETNTVKIFSTLPPQHNTPYHPLNHAITTTTTCTTTTTSSYRPTGSFHRHDRNVNICQEGDQLNLATYTQAPLTSQDYGGEIDVPCTISIEESSQTGPVCPLEPLEPLELSPQQQESPKPPCKMHHFEMVFQMESNGCQRMQNRLLKRLRRRGVSLIELEPENRRINIQSRRPARVLLAVLRKMDPNARHLGSSRDALDMLEDLSLYPSEQQSQIHFRL